MRSHSPGDGAARPRGVPSAGRRVGNVRTALVRLAVAVTATSLIVAIDGDGVTTQRALLPDHPTGIGHPTGAPSGDLGVDLGAVGRTSAVLASGKTTTDSTAGPTGGAARLPDYPVSPEALVFLPSAPAGIPRMVLLAYRRAELLLSQSTPKCHLAWSLLAGIGRIESGHASGGRVDANGTTLSPILGPLLDGSNPGDGVVHDTDGGRLDGSSGFDRAVGPMQFLPQTWTAYGADGNGDGVADPNNVFDAALAAGNYLCSGGLDTADAAQARTAVFRYNHSDAYVINVLTWAAAYDHHVEPIGSQSTPAPAKTVTPAVVRTATAPVTTTAQLVSRAPVVTTPMPPVATTTLTTPMPPVATTTLTTPVPSAAVTTTPPATTPYPTTTTTTTTTPPPCLTTPFPIGTAVGAPTTTGSSVTTTTPVATPAPPSQLPPGDASLQHSTPATAPPMPPSCHIVGG